MGRKASYTVPSQTSVREAVQIQLEEAAERERNLRERIAQVESQLQAQQAGQDEIQRKMMTESKDALRRLETRIESEARHREHVEDGRNSLIEKLSISERLYLAEVDKSTLASNECGKLQAQLSLSEMTVKAKDEQIAKATDGRDDLNRKLVMSDEARKLTELEIKATQDDRILLQTKVTELEERLTLETSQRTDLMKEYSELQTQFSELQEQYNDKLEEEEREATEIEKVLEAERNLVTSAMTTRFGEEVADLRASLETTMNQEAESRLAPIQQGLVILAGKLASETTLRQRAERECDSFRTELFDMKQLAHRLQTHYGHSPHNNYGERREQRIITGNDVAFRPLDQVDHRERDHVKARTHRLSTAPSVPDAPYLGIPLRDSLGSFTNWNAINGHNGAIATKGHLYQGADGRTHIAYADRRHTPLDSDSQSYSASADSDLDHGENMNGTPMESTTTASHHSAKHQGSSQSEDMERRNNDEYVPVQILDGRRKADTRLNSPEERASDHTSNIHQPTPLRPVQLKIDTGEDNGHDQDEPMLLLPYADPIGRPVFLFPNPNGRIIRATPNGRVVEEDQNGVIWGFQRSTTVNHLEPGNKNATRRPESMSKVL
ncbi:uncharacterized protein BKA55DRAFT_696812 [Fusarium redolens]|uniref:Uncharacterized protein n=1 Tax=Fusarium redolens TaxID=48865 RepID=A0A9P9FZI3_FUSRE|nr:uncharacterized protein BKA55DRAFT_696812 [Fusarium redolens]KAH7228483.1 hypothetical protein BKA55DRAFT_696812 [Fusarium redolens]